MNNLWILEKLQIPLKYSINSIYGPSGVGKTTLAYLIIKKEILSGNEVYYIDTERGFSIKRLLQIFPEFQHEKFSNKFQKIEILKFKELNEFLRKINLNNKTLIVDSISMPYRLELKDDWEEINKELAKTLHILLEKLNETNKVVLINHSYTKDNEIRIIGGDLISYYSKVLIEVLFEGNLRIFRIKKHKFKEESTIKTEVVKEGFKEKKWFI